MATKKKELFSNTSYTNTGNKKTTYSSTPSVNNVIDSVRRGTGNAIGSAWQGASSGANMNYPVGIYPNNTTYAGYDVLPAAYNLPGNAGKTGITAGVGTSGTPFMGDALGYGQYLGGRQALLTGEANNPQGGGAGGSTGSLRMATPTYNPYAAYQSKYQPQIDDLMNALLNRSPFSYDYLSDPTYQAYRQQYEFQGDRARENAIGDYAANTGGLRSSWATTAGQLRQNNYNAQLNSLIPELENAAYNRYMGEVEMDRANLNDLQNLENTDYSRYLQERDYDLQMQQLNNSLLARASRRSGGGSGGSGSSEAGDEDLALQNAMAIAKDVANGLSMPTATELKKMGITKQEVQQYVPIYKAQSQILGRINGTIKTSGKSNLL